MTRSEFHALNAAKRNAYVKERLRESGATILREDGRLEKSCEHGVGHPVGHLFPGEWQDWMHVHGCDGCCSKWAMEKYTTQLGKDLMNEGD